MRVRKRKVTQVRVQPSRFSVKAGGENFRYFPCRSPLENNCNNVPIHYDPELIFNREQFLELPPLTGPVEVRCGRTS